MNVTKGFSCGMLAILKCQREIISEKYSKQLEDISNEDNSQGLQDLKIKQLISDYLNEIRKLTKDINELKLLISSLD